MEWAIYMRDSKYDFQIEQPVHDTLLLSEPLLGRKEAAAILRVSPGTLAVWDCTKRFDLRPIKVGNRVRYTRTNLIRFLHDQQQAKDVKRVRE